MDTVRQNTAWAQSHATPSTRAAHPALSSSLDLAWSTSIGQGDTRRQRITAQPVAANGVVFTLDSAARVTATSYDGTQVWTRDLTPPRERADEATGGALALGGGRLYVASAFGRLSALDPATGAEIWTQRLGTTGTGAVTRHRYATPGTYTVTVEARDTTGLACGVDRDTALCQDFFKIALGNAVSTAKDDGMQDHVPRKLRTFAQNHGLTPIDNTPSVVHHLLEKCEGTHQRPDTWLHLIRRSMTLNSLTVTGASTHSLC